MARRPRHSIPALPRRIRYFTSSLPVVILGLLLISACIGTDLRRMPKLEIIDAINLHGPRKVKSGTNGPRLRVMKMLDVVCRDTAYCRADLGPTSIWGGATTLPCSRMSSAGARWHCGYQSSIDQDFIVKLQDVQPGISRKRHYSTAPTYTIARQVREPNRSRPE
ncbi:hypothetical protein BJ546DRAFT_529540 [Cryomyces antarcticus]